MTDDVYITLNCSTRPSFSSSNDKIMSLAFILLLEDNRLEEEEEPNSRFVNLPNRPIVYNKKRKKERKE